MKAGPLTNQQKRHSQYNGIFHGIFGIIIFSIWICVSSCIIYVPYTVDQSQEPVSTAMYTPQSQTAPVPETMPANASPSLTAALKVKQNLYDIDKDGRIDCVDAAVLFRQYYGNGQTAKLIWHNNQANGGLNHLYVKVPDGAGGWTAIEPRAYDPDINKRTMKYAWGNRYQPEKYDIDVTGHAVAIRNGAWDGWVRR
jgi:hypothetical protein